MKDESLFDECPLSESLEMSFQLLDNVKELFNLINIEYSRQQHQEFLLFQDECTNYLTQSQQFHELPTKSKIKISSKYFILRFLGKFMFSNYNLSFNNFIDQVEFEYNYKPHLINRNSAGVVHQLKQGWIIPSTRLSNTGLSICQSRMKRIPNKKVDFELLTEWATYILLQIYKWTVQRRQIFFVQCSDFQGFNLLPLEMINWFTKKALKIANSLPMNSKYLIAVNPSTFFQLGQNIVKIFMNEDQKSKLRMISDKELPDQIDFDNIPIFMNGNWFNKQIEDD